MKLPELQIGRLVAKIPIVQGGMAVRISTARLAAAVAEAGGIGLIAGSGMGPEELRDEIRQAKALTNGIVGVNIMVAVRHFAELIRTAVNEGIDLIVAGAGFSRDLFQIGKQADIPVVPIVSTAKLARISEMLGASAVVVEGKEAGGHLGTDRSMKDIVPEVRQAVKIPVIAAGGIMNGQDIVDALRLGANGVQMGTIFAASEESNADQAFKEYYLQSKKEDIMLIKSPVGLPGRALINTFSEKVLKGIAPKPDKCIGCLKECAQNFCIMEALEKAQRGDAVSGLIFAGEYVYKIKEILSVRQIFENLLHEVAECK